MKRKNGFTLIELLAVIVILAIIALIATPIVLNIINDAKSESGLRSADFYLDALELSIAQATLDGQNITDGTYDILESGNLCLSYDASEKCIEELKVEVKGETPKSGTIDILNGEIEGALFPLDNKEITKNSKGEIVYIKTLEEVCELKEGTAKTAGAKYECKVDPNKDPYTFYVLTTPKTEDKSINLIMDQNINSDGTPAGMTGVTKNGDNVYNLEAWINQGDYESVGGQNWSSWTDNNAFGPITAMNFLSEATKSWTNTNEIKTSTIAYENGSTYTMAKTYTTNARMPIYSSDATKTEVADKTDANAYLYDNLDPERINAPYGYWTLSPRAENSSYAWLVNYGGYVGSLGMRLAYSYGVRPVINLKI